ncbi:MAG: hypothetical protein ACFCD0_16975 [Gemmataceae bacterium]
MMQTIMLALANHPEAKAALAAALTGQQQPEPIPIPIQNTIEEEN